MSKLFYQQLSTVGDGTGTVNMAVDGSSTPVIFKVAPAPGEIVKLARVMIYVQDSGAFDAEKWGNNITLTNGIQFKHKENAVTSNLIPVIQSSGEMASVCHDIVHESFGTGDEFLSFRWTFTKAGKALEMHGSDGDELQVVINDNLTGLTKMTILSQGIID